MWEFVVQKELTRYADEGRLRRYQRIQDVTFRLHPEVSLIRGFI
jgi:hypothetical protein